MKKVHNNFTDEKMILRDHLALDRTILANERTFLSYIRTTLAVVVVGVTISHFAEDLLLHLLGVVIIGGGVIILVIGVKRTLDMSKKIYRTSTKS